MNSFSPTVDTNWWVRKNKIRPNLVHNVRSRQYHFDNRYSHFLWNFRSCNYRLNLTRKERIQPVLVDSSTSCTTRKFHLGSFSPSNQPLRCHTHSPTHSPQALARSQSRQWAIRDWMSSRNWCNQFQMHYHNPNPSRQPAMAVMVKTKLL